MAPPKRKAGGRVTPKGTRPGSGKLPATDPAAPSFRGVRHDEEHPEASSRYTPPTPAYVKESPRWVPVLMFALLGLGLVMIVLNYLELLPGAVSNWYLLGGLGLIFAGIITATQYR
jgi:hypothetical protein